MDNFEMIKEQRINLSNVPKRTRGLSLDRLKRTEGNEAAFDLVDRFLEGKVDPPLVLLLGVPGVGKSTLALVIGWDFLERAEKVYYYQAEELLNLLQSKQEDAGAFGKTWDRLKNYDLVILDDLDARNRTPWRDSQVDALVDYRYREALPLIICANNLEGITDRVVDRLKDGETAIVRGESWRGKKKGAFNE